MKILIIRFSSLGDLVTLDLTFRAIRHFHKDAEMTFFTSGIGKGLYQDSCYFDKYIIKEKNIFSNIQKLRIDSYDLVINLQCNKPSHYYNSIIEKKKNINKSFSLFQKIFNIKVQSKDHKAIIENCNVDKKDFKKYFDDISCDLIMLPTIREKRYLEENYKYIALSIGSSERWLSKQWGVKNYIELIKKLYYDNYKIVLVGSNLEEKDSLEIENSLDFKIINFVNKTNLTQLKNLLSEVSLYIGNDSGPTHIAAGVGTSTFTIFGPTSFVHAPSMKHNRGKHEFIIPDESISCAPCYKGTCPTNLECMDNINMSKVYEKIKNILDDL